MNENKNLERQQEASDKVSQTIKEIFHEAPTAEESRLMDMLIMKDLDDPITLPESDSSIIPLNDDIADINETSKAFEAMADELKMKLEEAKCEAEKFSTRIGMTVDLNKKRMQRLNEDSESLEEAVRYGTSHVVKLKETLLYNGKEYTELSFAWSKIRGSDLVRISQLIKNNQGDLGSSNIEQTDEYAFYLAQTACEQPIGSDFMNYLCVCDYQRIKEIAKQYFFMWAYL